METRSIFRKFEDLEEKLVKKAFEVYQNSGQGYNTSLLIDEDGNIKEANNFGNTIYTGYEFELKITSQDKMAWSDLWVGCMSEAQKIYCEEQGWQCCYETDSDNPEDLKEYVVCISDFSETAVYISELIERYEDELEEINSHK